MGETQSLLKRIFHASRRVLAKHWLAAMPAAQIAITGSHGKTNTTRAITRVLSSSFPVIQTDTDLDTIYNVPITSLKVRLYHKAVIFELGIDQKNEMDLHLQIVKPEIAVITGLAPVHSDEEHLGSFENIIIEKRKLIEALPENGLAVLNWDDKNVRAMSEKTKAEVIFYGTDKKKCQIWADDIQAKLSDLRFKMSINDKKYLIKTHLLGAHHIYTCMAATAVALKMGITVKKIIKAINNLKPLKGRLSVEKGPFGTFFINDSLRANPESTKAGLLFLRDLETKNRKIAVLGEMGELGSLSVKKHQETGEIAARAKLNYLICVGPLQKYTAREALKHGMSKNKAFWVKDVFEAANCLKKILKNGDLFYLKASLLRHTERILLLLSGQKVGCRLTVCEFYNNCRDCKYLESGLENKG